MSAVNRRMVAFFAYICGALVVAGCTSGENLSDAYGNFESTEVVISSEANGKLLSFAIDEGQKIEKGKHIGLVDTLQLSLKRQQLVASQKAVRSKVSGVLAQIDVLEEKKAVALTEKARLEKLLENQAATPKQLDDANGQISVLEREIRAIRMQNVTILSEAEALASQIAQLSDQISKSIIINPMNGVVLTKYTEPFEITAYGKPLYKIAHLDTLYLRAYISGSQLPHIRLGQRVDVLIDEDQDENRTLSGEISWISSQAEFTPKTIQTKEERVNLVYAVKVRVANPDGVIKIGMPGEVRFVE